MAGVKTAVIGVGNVGTTFSKGLQYYSNGSNKIGLWHHRVAGLRPADIKIVAAFDVDPGKVGKPLSEAGRLVVQPGIVDEQEKATLKPEARTTDGRAFYRTLEESGADVVLNLVSSGLDRTSLAYAKSALKAGMSFVNATPSKIARNSTLYKSFAKEKLVLAGDDLLSQLGGTAFHKGMIDFMVERGVHVNRSYQLDVGGSEETKKTMDERIKMAKREMKTESIGFEAPYAFESVAGTTEYSDFLGDSRNSYYWMSSTGFMGSEIIMDLTLRTSDGPNAGNVLFDVVRATAKPKKRPEVISAYGFKNPPTKLGIRKAYAEFVKLYA